MIAILLPVLSSARDAAQRTQCASNMRQIGIGYYTWAVDRKGKLPLGYVNSTYTSN